MPAASQHTLFEPGPAARPLRIAGTEVYAGTCSWADPHFVKEGEFYPQGVRSRPDARLKYYATVFPTVEIDATYYALLPPEYARRYAQWTPDGFVFHVKAFGLFTGHGADPRRLPRHIAEFLPAELYGRRRIADEDLPEEVETMCWEYFLEFLRGLRDADRLGYVLFQFPPWQKYYEKWPRRASYLRRMLEGYRMAVEFRHRSWLDPAHRDAVLRSLREHGVIYVVPDEPQLDWTVPPDVEITSDWSVVRFHGRNAQAWAKRGAETKEVYDYLYSEKELRAWAERTREIAGRVDRVFMMFNNHVRGNSARNAQMILQLLAGP
ncbi:MAG: DUF72 domain-containing protein [Armatimonadota bacterium]|nr:DUF72 domain-containing protein [Armatimonadota bacterium]MDR5696627.1 DUF72 domain-containing protein [Armatimonadota bacterium]